MPKVLGFLILHYGRPYLRAALQSILPQVDKVVILYTPKPSQGFQADIPCPDTRKDLYHEILMGQRKAECQHKPVVAYDGEWANESDHINAVWQYAKGFDWVWRFDADEVSPPGMVAEMIRQATEHDYADLFRAPFIHFWRSFSRVCRDGSHPIRLFRIRSGGGTLEKTLDSRGGKWEVFHFGYAQPTRYIEYKQMVSGHRPEWRPDWFKDRWLANAQADVHPVMFPTHWMPENFDKTKLPACLKSHPFYSMDLIE